MKMKLIMVLLAMLDIVSGNICPNNRFVNIRRSHSHFKGAVNYLRKGDDIYSDMSGFSAIYGLEILNTEEPGILTLKMAEKAGKPLAEQSRSILSSNLVCYREKKWQNCRVQYITLESNILIYKQFVFQYPVPKGSVDLCEDNLRTLLNRKTCEVEDIEYYFQIFSIPVTRLDGTETKARYDTKSGMFEFDGQSVDKEDVEVRMEHDKAIFIINGNHSEFKDSDSCFKLSNYILSLDPPEDLQVHESLKDKKLFYYYYVWSSNGLLTMFDIPSTGRIDLTSLDDIAVVEHPDKKLILREFYTEIALPKYKKYQIYFEVSRGLNVYYSFYVDFRSEKHYDQVKEKLLQHTSCTSGSSLNYYQQVNLQNGIKDKLDGKIEVLIFKTANVVEEFSKNLNIPINTIFIYDMRLETDQDDKDWLFIKGKDKFGKLIYKKYRVRVRNYCLNGIFKQRILSNFLNVYEKTESQRQYYFWEVIGSEGADDKLKSIGGLIDLKNNNIVIGGQKSPFYLIITEIHGKYLRVKIKLQGNSMTIFIRYCQQCYQIFVNHSKSKVNLEANGEVNATFQSKKMLGIKIG
jgi:hypothetical protein